MMRVIPFLLYLWLLAMHEVFLKDVTSIWGATINLGILIILLTAVYKSEITVLWVSFMVGLIGYTASGSVWGWHILLLVIIAAVAFQIKERMNLDSIRSKVLLVFGGTLVHNIIVLLLHLPRELSFMYAVDIVTGTLYTTLIGWLFFLVKERKVTGAKVKEIF